VENHSEDMSTIPSEGDNEGSESSEDQSQESTRVEEIALRRSNRQTQTPIKLRDYVYHKVMYHIQEFISYNKVSPQYQALLSSIDKQIEPMSFDETNKNPIWYKAMEEELKALKKMTLRMWLNY
jgi:hypothetical protein